MKSIYSLFACGTVLILASAAPWAETRNSKPATAVQETSKADSSVSPVPQTSKSSSLKKLDQPAASSVSVKTDREIARWKQATEKDAKDVTAWARLTESYLQKARETNDPSYYTPADAALTTVQKLEPDHYRAMSLRSQLHSTRHQFAEAIVWTEKAIKANASDPLNYGILGDIYAELGQYEKAEENYQKMMELRPGRASYARASYLSELYGDENHARMLMQMAISAGSPRGEDAAWCYVYLGHLNFNGGFLPAAEKAYEAALTAFPGYFHAYAGLGKVKAAKKEYPEAIQLYQKALQSGPHHEVLAALIELYTVTGEKDKAKEQRDRLAQLQQKYLKNEMDIDFEVAEIDVEHGRDLAKALEMAKEEVKTHGNVKAYGSLAWIALLNDDLATAQTAMDKAMSLGTQSPLTFYHAARIREKQGDKQASIRLYHRALNKCPYFHVRYAADARSRVERLTKSVIEESQVAASSPKQ